MRQWNRAGSGGWPRPSPAPTPSPMAAIGVSTFAVSVSQGAMRPTAPASSAMAVARTTGIGNGAIPVWVSQRPSNWPWWTSQAAR